MVNEQPHDTCVPLSIKNYVFTIIYLLLETSMSDLELRLTNTVERVDAIRGRL